MRKKKTDELWIPQDSSDVVVLECSKYQSKTSVEAVEPAEEKEDRTRRFTVALRVRTYYPRHSDSKDLSRLIATRMLCWRQGDSTLENPSIVTNKCHY